MPELTDQVGGQDGEPDTEVVGNEKKHTEVEAWGWVTTEDGNHERQFLYRKTDSRCS